MYFCIRLFVCCQKKYNKCSVSSYFPINDVFMSCVFQVHQLLHAAMRDPSADSDSTSGCSADMSNTDSGRGPSEDGDHHHVPPGGDSQIPPPYGTYNPSTKYHNFKYSWQTTLRNESLALLCSTALQATCPCIILANYVHMWQATGRGWCILFLFCSHLGWS